MLSKRIILLHLLSLVAIRPQIGLAQLSDSNAIISQTKLPIVHVTRLKKPAPEIDGRGDDLAWKDAKPVEWVTDFAGNITSKKTRFRTLWQQNALYMLWELESIDFNTDLSKPNNTEQIILFKENCVELFLATDPTKPKRYYEIELGPYGHFNDLFVDLSVKRYDTSFSSQLLVKATQDQAARTATIEAVLTAPEITHVFIAGAHLPVGLFRIDGKEPKSFLAWNPARTKRPNFHIPNAFGTLVFGE